MAYYLIAETVKLDGLQKRIMETDLIPSRIFLLENIKEKFKTLKAQNISTLEDLRNELKNAKKISSLSIKTGIDINYLTLLRREIEGYFPKAASINAFNWLQKKELSKLEKHGFKNAAILYDTLDAPEKRKEIVVNLEIDSSFIDTIFSLADLTRIQWVSPITARLLYCAGYKNAEAVSKADAEKLCDSIDKVNKENKFFKGKIGLKDIKRLIKAASYVK